jgi:antitoxin VapB
MALNIRNPEADRLAERVAFLAGETKTTAVVQALRERLERLERERAAKDRARPRLADRLGEIARHSAQLPVLDPRPADEILGYDENGLPR